MGIKSIFSMLKADRYMQDGRDKLAEDKIYQTGQISEKTGLQKQPDGSWKPPKGNASKSSLGGEAESQSLRAAAKAVGEVNKAKTIKQKTEILEEYGWNSDDGGQTWTNTINGVNQKIKADMQTGEFKLVKPAGSENKPAEKKPDGADRHEKVGGEIKSNLEAAKYYFDKAQSFSTTDPSYKTYMGKAKEYNDKAKAQADDYGFDFEEMHNSGVTRAVNKYTEEQSKHKNFMENSQKHFEAANSVATTETDKANLKKIKSFMDEEHGTFKNALYNNAESLVRKGSNGAPDRENEKSLLKFAEAAGMGDDLKLYLKEEVNSKYDFGGGDAEKKPAAPKPSVQEYMKAQDTVKKYEETYRKQLEEYENGQRLRANGGGAILDPMYGLKPNDLSKNEEYQKAKDIIQRMEAEDSAPQTYTAQTVNAPREKLARTLTGDTKIKVRRK